MVPRSSGTRAAKAIVCVRVSTAEQAVENQTPELLQRAEARGFEVTEVIEDVMSAAKQRPGLERMMKLAHGRQAPSHRVLQQGRNRLYLSTGVSWGAVSEAEVTKEVADTLERFEAWKKKIVVNPNILSGEPVFPKSRLSVRHLGGLVLRDASEEIREDYPYLSEQDIEFAKLYALAYPKRGRPREGRPPVEK